MIYPWHLYLLSGIFILAGIMHFLKPRIYLRIMPRYLPSHLALVYLSGAAEILLGAGLAFPETKNIAVYGLLLMLLAFLLVHFYMLSSKKAGAGIPLWLLWLRVPLQFLLMGWIAYYLQF